MSKKATSTVSRWQSFREYFELSKLELRKVSWPSLKETRQASLVVLGFVLVMSVFLGLVDFGLSKLMAFILAA